MLPDGLTIRRMTVADHRVVGEVGFAAWASSDALNGDWPSRDIVDRVEKAYLDFARDTADRIDLAEIDGRIVGWAARAGDPHYISDLWVHPECQGQGIGAALIAFLCAQMRSQGHAMATIHTHAANAGAIRLYQRCGFSIVWRGLEYSKSMGVELEKVHLARPLT